MEGSREVPARKEEKLGKGITQDTASKLSLNSLASGFGTCTMLG